MSATLLTEHKAEAHSQPFMMKSRPSLGLLIERSAPFMIGVAAGFLVVRTPSLWILHANWRELFLDKILDLEIGQLAGLFAVVAFLPALEEKTVIRKLKQWGRYRNLIAYIREAMVISALATFLSIAFIVCPENLRLNVHVDRTASAALWFLICYSAAASFRIIRLSVKSLLAE
jgi:hypothetical protein